MNRSAARSQVWALAALVPATVWVVIWLLGPDGTDFDFGVSIRFSRDLGIIWRASALIGPVLALVFTIRGLGQSVSREQHPVTAEWVAIGAGSAVLLALVMGTDLPARGGARADEDVVAGSAAPARGPDLSTGTHVLLLGTGTPNAEPSASGPATAVIVDGHAYIVDAGPGVVRRASAAAERYRTDALALRNLDIVFLTHLHSDHTVGLPDLIHTPWVQEREAPLRVFGPAGTENMAEHITAAWSADIENRLSGRQFATPDGWRVVARDVAPGVVYEDERVRVTAFPVSHTGWSQALGYRFDTADRSIVISGDTTPTDIIVAMCNGCDVLLHEVYSASAFANRPAIWQSYHAQAHTSTSELGALAVRARPGLLILHHQLMWGASPGSALEEIRQAGYEGDLAYGRDLEVY